MSKSLKPRRGTTAEHASFIGQAHEITYDTDKNTLVTHDGVTPGGFPLLRADQAGLPLGFEYVRLTGQSAPLGGVDYMGQTATRAMYADLWAWLQTNKPDAIVSESEWQSLYSSQNGNVAKYSSGDGSTTFRFPRVVGYFKGANSTAGLGEYTEEGLPNITGDFDCRPHKTGSTSWGGALLKNASGAFTVTLHGGTRSTLGVAETTTESQADLASFDASLSNPIFGNSLHVTPETVTIVMGVIAIGSVASIGEATEEGIVAEVANLGASKASVDASNFSAEGKALLAGLGMPSIRFVNLTLGASNSKYTAPANGYYFIDKKVSSSGQYFWFTNTTTGIALNSVGIGNGDNMLVLMPVKKGDVVQVIYNAGGALNKFRFYYAEGAE